jgi:hypothetical protein
MRNPLGSLEENIRDKASVLLNPVGWSDDAWEQVVMPRTTSM